MNNASNEYCYEKVARKDSALYYSLRYLKPHERDAVVAVHAFYREMEDVIFECQNHELALIKFTWWRSEILKLTTGESDHPVLALLRPAACPRDPKDPDVIQKRLLKIVDGFEQYSISSHFETFEDVVVHWMRTAGERELLLNDILQNENVISVEMLYQLMILLELVRYIQHLRLYTRHGVILFSADEMRQFNVTQTMLSEYVTTDAIKKLLENQLVKVTRAYAVIKNLTSKQRMQLSHLVIRCEIARVVLDEIQKSDFNVLENLILLTPIRYWWIAFRAR